MFVEMPQEIAREARERLIERRFLLAEAISLMTPRMMTRLVHGHALCWNERYIRKGHFRMK
jgi:hypothetical protein